MRYLKQNTKEINLSNINVKSLCDKFDFLDADIIKLLISRNVDTESKIVSFFSDTYENLTSLTDFIGMKEATERINIAIANKETIVIYGDYDCDGICSVSILYKYFLEKGVNVKYFIPDRFKDGYGLNAESIELIAESVFPDLIITVDCGITAVEEVKHTQELGIDIIITDHHEPPVVLPDCIIVNPKLNEKGFKNYCGCGVALRLIEALSGVEDAKQYLDIVAIATIGDIVPLIEDNRVLVREGLVLLKNTKNKGLSELLKKLKLNFDENLSTEIAFKLVPRINSIGRLDNANKMVDLFFDNEFFTINNLINEIEKANSKRKELTDVAFNTAITLLDNYKLYEKKVIVLASDAWEEGVIGIVCSRLAEQFNRPVILLKKKEGILKGSGRSIEGVNLYFALKACESYLEHFGGHSMACGLAISQQNLDSFIMVLDYYLNSKYEDKFFLPTLKFDFMLNKKSDSNSIKKYNCLAPFGAENKKPVFAIEENLKYSRIASTNHIKAILNKDVELIGYNNLDKLQLFNDSFQHLAFLDLSETEYQNRKFIQGIIKDVQMDQDIIANFNDSYFAKAVYQIVKNNNTIFKIDYCNFNKCFSLIDKGIYGTCFVCYNVHTYNKFIKYIDNLKASDKLVWKSIEYKFSKNNYNMLILSPANIDICLYENLVFLDSPFSLGVIDEMQINKNCKIFICEDTQEENKTLVSKNIPTYENLGKIFKQLNKMLSEGEYRSFSVAYKSYIVEFDDINVIEFYIALYVFYELEILKQKKDGYLFIDKTVKSNLNNSKIFNKIKKNFE